MKLFIYLTFFVVSMSSAIDTPPIKDQGCEDNEKLAILYLNGVWNNAFESLEGLNQVENLVTISGLDYGVDYNQICFKMLYNQDDSFFDWVEALAQKIRESDSSLSEDEVYDGVSKFLFLNKIDNNFEFDNDLRLEEIISERVRNAEYSTLSSTSNIVRDELALRSTVIVSHSQGNLFANLISETVREDDFLVNRFNKYANLQIATPASHITASEFAKGDYYTSKTDRVISYIPDLVDFDILNPNLQTKTREKIVLDVIDQSPSIVDYPMEYDYDIFGHNFINVYTNNLVTAILDGESQYRTMGSIFLEKLQRLARFTTVQYIEEIIPYDYQQLGDNEGFLRLGIKFKPEFTGRTIQIDNGQSIQRYLLNGAGGEMVISTSVSSFTEIQEINSQNQVTNRYNISAPTVVKFSDFTDVQYYGYYESDSPYIKPHIEASYNIYYGGIENSSTYSNTINTIGQKESAMLTLRAFCKIVPNGKEDEDGNSETLYELRDAIENTVIAELDSCNNYSADGYAEMVFLNQKSERIGDFEIVFEDKTAVVPND